MSALAFIWFLLIGVLIAGYFILDGFDLGIGVLYPVLAQGERERAVLRRAIGPVWDGNEVWLLTGGGALFAAFAPAYATSFSGFYLAIMLVLFGLILRAIALEYRAHDTAWARVYDVLLTLGSLLPALLFGVAVGNVVRGLDLNAHGDYVGTFFDLLNPFSLACGVLGLAHMLVQGCAWAALKAPADSALASRARTLRTRLCAAEMVVFVVASALLVLQVTSATNGAVAVRGAALVFAVIYCASVLVCGWMHHDLAAHVAASAGCVGLVGIAASSLFPNLINATVPEYAISIAGAAATPLTLGIMLVIAAIGVPIVLVYHVIAYRIFRGRLAAEDLDY